MRSAAILRVVFGNSAGDLSNSLAQFPFGFAHDFHRGAQFPTECAAHPVA